MGTVAAPRARALDYGTSGIVMDVDYEGGFTTESGMAAAR
jgi:hypothetical protein